MIRDDLTEAVRAALVALGIAPIPEDINLQRPARREHGDWSSNVALVLAKTTGRNPRELATEITQRLTDAPPPRTTAVEVAGPGFVNFRLDDGWLHDILRQVVAEGIDGYARHDLGQGERVNVEFVSANPTGPLHVGAGRWAAYGDSVCRLLDRCGYEPHREYYINDRGNQVDLFVESLQARKHGRDLPEGGYQGQYVVEWAAEMPDDADPTVWGYDRVMRDLAETLGRMNVLYDTWFSERSLVDSGALDAALVDLRNHGAAYDRDGAVWFRATNYGHHDDVVLVKTGGEPTYLLSDIAYHRNKFERGFEHLIDVWGADHHSHVSRLSAAVRALGHDPSDLEVLLGQLVTVQRGGEEVRMGRRSGKFVELAEVLDEVGPDVARLTFLLQSIDTRQVFDLESVVSESMENPVFYVQYAHARIASIGRVAAERSVRRAPFDTVNVSVLAHERELDVLRSLSELPDVVREACLARAPHRVSTWVRELAGRFHGFYHDCYVLGDGVAPELTQARLWLVESARIGLAIGLDLLGVSAPEAM
ncbi:MAG: arginine--tRNA ligase [Actinomycetota bacterium]|nr:arginine--tRNA ligase [Actinomycetota bacterium]